MKTRVTPPLFGIAIFAVVLAAGCGGERIDELRPGGSAPATDAPAATDAPTDPPAETAPPPAETAPPPAETAPPPVDEGDDEGDGNGTLLAIILVVGGLALLGAILSAVMRRGKQQTGAATTDQHQAAPVDPRPQLTSTARWYHDQLSLELLALPVAEAQQRWAAQRARLDQLSIDIRLMASRYEPEIWTGLAGAFDTSVASLDTALRVRGADDVSPPMIDEAIAIANRHRGELAAWLTAAERSLL